MTDFDEFFRKHLQSDQEQGRDAWADLQNNSKSYRLSAFLVNIEESYKRRVSETFQKPSSSLEQLLHPAVFSHVVMFQPQTSQHFIEILCDGQTWRGLYLSDGKLIIKSNDFKSVECIYTQPAWSQ